MKTTHLGLEERERALAGMRASQVGISVTEYITKLIADPAGRRRSWPQPILDAAKKEVGHAR